jgi:hypothetical protein
MVGWSYVPEAAFGGAGPRVALGGALARLILGDELTRTAVDEFEAAAPRRPV